MYTEDRHVAEDDATYLKRMHNDALYVVMTHVKQGAKKQVHACVRGVWWWVGGCSSSCILTLFSFARPFIDQHQEQAEGACCAISGTSFKGVPVLSNVVSISICSLPVWLSL